MTFIDKKLNKLPDKPGVYIMKDQFDNIIYVGKAISLKKRVKQYFTSLNNQPYKVKVMVDNIRDFDYIVVSSELEALILECNLIKEHKPKYNILLKDDKNYPYIMITLEEKFPRVIMTRRYENNKNLYFGPYSSVKAVKNTLQIIRELFPVRNCTKNLNKINPNDRPCLYYYINQCHGPCIGKISENDYNKIIDSVIDFLNGNYTNLLKELNNNMIKASENLNFETAASYRDKIQSIKIIMEKQRVISSDSIDQDVIGIVNNDNKSVAQIFFIRKGKLINSQQFILNMDAADEINELVSSFIKQFYLTSNFIPKEIIIQDEIEDKKILENWLSDKRGNRVYIRIPKRGNKKAILDMVLKNAEIAIDNIEIKIAQEFSNTIGALEELAEVLGLDSVPNRIEAFDISNIQGVDSVASMAVFEKGKSKKSDYRRFKINYIDKPDDYKSMSQVISRRFRRGVMEQSKTQNLKTGKFAVFPDIVLIDGGKGQLNAAINSIKDLGLNFIVFISLTEKSNIIYKHSLDEPIILEKNSSALKLLQRIRDEAHRFALTYHRSLHAKSNISSILEDIPNIGPSRRRELLLHFKSIESIRNADYDDLLKVKTMNNIAAKSIIDYFQSFD